MAKVNSASALSDRDQEFKAATLKQGASKRTGRRDRPADVIIVMWSTSVAGRWRPAEVEASELVDVPPRSRRRTGGSAGERAIIPRRRPEPAVVERPRERRRSGASAEADIVLRRRR